MTVLKRIGEKWKKNDEYRVFVDRLCPQLLSQEKTSGDLGVKRIASMSSLRIWFDHGLRIVKLVEKETEENQSSILSGVI